MLPWLYSLFVLALFLVLMTGVPIFPEALSKPVAGIFNLGMVVFALLHTVPLALAWLHLKQRDAQKKD